MTQGFSLWVGCHCVSEEALPGRKLLRLLDPTVSSPGGTEDKVVPRTIEKSSQGLLGVLGDNAALLGGSEKKPGLGLG